MLQLCINHLQPGKETTPLLTGTLPLPSCAVWCSVVKREVLCSGAVLPPAELALTALSSVSPAAILVLFLAQLRQSSFRMAEKVLFSAALQFVCANEQSCWHHVLQTLEVSTSSTWQRNNLKPCLGIVN